MTDQIDQTTSDEVVDIEDEAPKGGRGRRMFITGAGIAGAAALVGKAGTASAADGDNMEVGGEYTADSKTEIDITTGGSPIAGDDNAFKGITSAADNGSHTILGVTEGTGHAIAGVVNNTDNTVGATWGRHFGQGAAIEGDSRTETAELAGDANAVKGTVQSLTNGSHAVLGVSNGAGHSVAGDTPAMVPDAVGSDTMVPNTNTTAATWGRHAGLGAGIGGINTGTGYGGEFIGGKAHVRLIPAEGASAGAPADDDHAVGELYADPEGGLFYNTAEGNNWVRLNAPVATGGIVLFDDGQRAWDSREGFEPANGDKGRVPAGGTVEIDLTEFTDFVAGLQGALLNVTIEQPDPDQPGYATVFNGDTDDDDRPETSSINWGRQTDVVANSVTAKVGNDGTIKVFCLFETHLIIDVLGFVG